MPKSRTDKMPPKRNGKLTVVYTEKDYEGGWDDKGTLNLKLAEKNLILEAAKKCNYDRLRMARCLKITLRTLYDKLVNHSLKDVI